MTGKSTLSSSATLAGLDGLNQRVKRDLELIAYPSRPWMVPRTHPTGSHVYDVAIIGGGQCGLATAFGLSKDQVTNVIVLDENEPGKEGPWITYARMVTLRTNKRLTGPDLGIPSLTFQSYYETKYGSEAWEVLDKIPKEEWMSYLVWYRDILNIPVRNSTKVASITPDEATGGFCLSLTDTSSSKAWAPDSQLYARKVVLATGIQGGGEWHVPAIVRQSVEKKLYAHTCEDIDFVALKGKRIAILGGGASSFDNAQFALKAGVGKVEVFVRRAELPRINPIRFMEFAGFLHHFADLDDATKYAGIDFFMQFNQPPTNDTFNRASSYPNFSLHTASPWEKLQQEGAQVRIFTPQGDQGLFDFLIVSTGLLTDAQLRPELAAMADKIATWSDRFTPGPNQKGNPLIDAHPYLGECFEFSEKVAGTAPYVKGIFAFNYSALASLGLSASALSGMKYALPKLLRGITRQLFLDDSSTIIGNYLSYNTEEFVGTWPPTTAPAAANGAATAVGSASIKSCAAAAAAADNEAAAAAKPGCAA